MRSIEATKLARCCRNSEVSLRGEIMNGKEERDGVGAAHIGVVI